MPERLVYEFGEFRLDAQGHLLLRHSKPVPLTPKAVDLLVALVEAGGSPVAKEDLLQKVWADAAVEEGSLTSHISLLRKALGESADDRQFIETLPKRGYRFAAPIRTTADGLPQAPAAPSEAKLASADWPRVRIILLALMGIAALLVFGHFATKHFLARQQPQFDRLMIVVLPFQNLTGDPAQEFVSDGLTEEMITRLGELNYQQLGVIARTSAMTYKGTAKPVDQIARELGVNYIMEGSIRSWGQKVRISAQLISASDQTHLWSQNYERNSGDILALQSDVAQAIAKEIKVKLVPQARTHLSSTAPVKPEAYEAYLKGRYFWYKRTEEGMRKGIDYFNQAIQSQPDYAAAYVGLADSYSLLALRGIVPAKEAFPKARAAAEKALELDNALGDAYATLAHVRLHEWDWSDLDQEFKRALELNPGNAMAYSWYSEYLTTMGRSDESIAVVRKAQEIDPVSPVVSTTLPHAYYFARRFEPAMEYLRKSLDLDPNHFMLHLRLGQVYIEKHMHQQAIEEMQKAVIDSGRSTEALTGLAQAYAAAGMTGPMQEVIDELNRGVGTRYVSAYNVAKIYASLSDKRQTFSWLEKAYDEHNPDLIELRREPCFDSMRSDSRLASLLRRMNFPP
jgi:TolB-like protein/DNA-binding winged helix-turn-helix (wHTH) protein/lipopolysaccharide biosynthesis regulator YciM